MTEENRSADTADTTADGSAPAPVREESKAAARWWREVLAGPPTHDNGDDVQSLMGRLLGGISPELTGAELDAFEEELARYVDRRIEDDRRTWEGERRMSQLGGVDEGFFWISFGTDYGPDYLLAAAIEAAANRTSRPEVCTRAAVNRLPWKTGMSLRPGEVKVSRGYGAESALIYPREGARG